jgi:nitroreductase
MRRRATSAGESFFDVVARQRATRAFSDQHVDDEQVGRLLDAATRAPSAENAQPWVFIVVRHPSTAATIESLTQRAWAEGARDYSAKRLSPALMAEVEAGVDYGIGQAPVLIVVCADSSLTNPNALPASIFPAVQNLLLAATALGLASALTTLTTIYRAELASALGLPEHVWPMAVIPIGYPERARGAPRREHFSTKTYRERYGTNW